MSKQRALELKELIIKYDKQYYELGNSEISDTEYDRLYKEYEDLEKQYPELKEMADSPTRKVGAGDEALKNTSLPKFKHKSPLLSIDRKAKEISELKDFYLKVGGDGVSVIVEPKLDGITCNINYENNNLANAATRGNGYIGDLITANFINTDSVYPLHMEDIEVRGEAIIPYDFFKDNLSEDYSNPRNAVAGIMRQIDPTEVKGKGVRVMFYDIGETSINLSDSDYDNVLMLKEKGFGSVPVLKANNWHDLEKIIEAKLDNMIQEIDGFNVLCANGYPKAICDGLVIKVDSYRLRKEIGFSEKGPKWAFAYKFKPLQATTIINHVDWQVGKSGRITPVAVFDEVSLGGTRISKATLNNIEYMEKLPLVINGEIDLDHYASVKYHDVILIERSNDVIPRVVAIQEKNHEAVDNEDAKSFSEPHYCPNCASELERIGPLIFCHNPNCSAKIKGLMTHYASRNAMNIVGLGESIIDLFYDLGFVRNISDIYKLSNHRDEILKLDKFGEKKTDNLLNSIEASRNPELYQFIYALSIPNIGKKTAKDLAQRYHNIGNFLNCTKEELLSIEDMGDIMADGLLSYIHSDNTRNIIDNLLKEVKPKEVSLNGDKFKGKTFVITGTLANPRSYYQEIIEKNGGKCSNSVSKKTDYVLIGTDAGSKESKARELVKQGANIIILDNEEMINNLLNE